MIIRLMIQEKVLMLLLVTIVFEKSFTLYWHQHIRKSNGDSNYFGKIM